MTAIKINTESKTILDISHRDALSKNFIKQSLRQLEVMFMYSTNPDNFIQVDNNIKVGIFTINLLLISDMSDLHAKHLKKHKFGIAIMEGNKYINLNKDARFNHQYWINANKDFNFKVENLVDLIVYCNRLNNLKAFS